MLATLLAFPVLGVLVILQMVVVSRIPLIYGTADIVLLALIAWALHERVKSTWAWVLVGGLMVSLVSALPLLALLWSYLIVIALTRLLRRRVWQAPILAMFLMSFIGTLISHTLSLVLLTFSGGSLPVAESINLVTLPSALLNLILALPVYAIINDLANSLYPEELEV